MLDKEIKSNFKLGEFSLLSQSIKLLAGDTMKYEVSSDELERNNIDKDIIRMLNRRNNSFDIFTKNGDIRIARFTNKETVGDLKISYHILPNETITVAGMQH